MSGFCMFNYRRPRGIMGNYRVDVFLILGDTETGEVWVARNRDHNCGHCGKQEPQHVAERPSNGTLRAVMYNIRDIVAGDIITIKIKDEEVVPIQETRHKATMEGFYHEPVPFRLNGNTWDSVCLNPVYLTDLDRSNKAFDVVPRESKPRLPQPVKVMIEDGTLRIDL